MQLCGGTFCSTPTSNLRTVMHAHMCNENSTQAASGRQRPLLLVLLYERIAVLGAPQRAGNKQPRRAAVANRPLRSITAIPRRGRWVLFSRCNTCVKVMARFSATATHGEWRNASKWKNNHKALRGPSRCK